MKGVPFLSKMVYKRVRGWATGQSLHHNPPTATYIIFFFQYFSPPPR